MANHRYTMQDKLQAAMAYLITRSSVKASEITGINERSIRYWMKAEWWDDMMAEAAAFKNRELDGKLTKMIDEGMSKMQDRLNQGDPVIKDGTIHYLPVKFRDLFLGIGVLMEKRAALRTLLDKQEEKTKALSGDTDLAELSKKLANMGVQVKDEAVGDE